jgi:DNA repair protein RadD
MILSSSVSNYILRGYQERDIGRIREAFERARRVLYVAPCGAGKTVIFTELVRRVLAKNRRILILCHRYELLEQISNALRPAPHGILVGRYRACDNANVASVQTLARRERNEWPRADLIVIDEAHHVAQGNAWATILAQYPRARILGVTATPCRMDGRPLADHFDTMVLGPSYGELEHDGYLTPVAAWSPPSIDCRGLRIRAGEFEQEGLAERSARASVTGDAILHYQRLGHGRRAIVFDVGVDSARRRTKLFLEAEIAAEAIDGTQTHQERSSAVARFRTGATKVLVSVDLVSEGFDLPAIEVGISLRPTLSLGLWMQQAGRILRPMEGKSMAILLDHAGNLARHGFPNDERDWSLARTIATGNSRQSQPSLRICSVCFLASRAGIAQCPNCGTPFPAKAREIEEREGGLAKITKEQARRIAAARFERERRSARSFEALVTLGRQRGMKSPRLWAKHVLKSRGIRHGSY